jgi:uncharacterized repeat protein (TIGR03847 family)
MTVDFGVARGIDAQSFGQPGQRTFRLRIVGAAFESAFLWMEKEHLQALSFSLQQVLSEFKHEPAPQAADVGEFPDAADHDFRIGRIGIGLSPSDRMVILQVGELGEEQDYKLRFRLTLDHCASLLAQLNGIIVAGRPRCQLCGRPMDPSGHMCSRSNGHSSEPIPDADSGGP